MEEFRSYGDGGGDVLLRSIVWPTSRAVRQRSVSRYRTIGRSHTYTPTSAPNNVAKEEDGVTHATNRINWLDNELMNELADVSAQRSATALCSCACRRPATKRSCARVLTIGARRRRRLR